MSILACVLAALLLSAAAGCHRDGSAQDRALAKAGGDRFDDTLDKRRR
jgi:hypothetical protein